MLHWKFHGGKLCEALLLTFLFAFKHDSNLLKARRVEGRCDACKGIAKWCKDNEHESVVCVSFLHLQKQWTGKSALGKGKASAIHEFLGSIRFHSHSSWHEGVTICWTEAVKLNAMRCHEAMTNWQVTICEKQLSWTRLPPKWSVDVYRQLGGGVVHKTDQLTCPKPWWMTLNWGVDRIFQQAQRLPVCLYHLTSGRRSGFICMRSDRNGVETGPKMMFAWDNSVCMHNCIIYIYIHIHMVPLPKSLPFSWAKWAPFIYYLYI